MINFRFHIVSLIAVFLALGLGILVGSTVVDQKIVDRLDTDIQRVSKENSERRDTNKQLAQENARLRDYINQLAPYAGDGRLDDQSIAVIAERGVDSSDVKQTVETLRAAGADVPGAVWLEDSWQLDTDERVQELQTALGISGNVSSTREAALQQVAARLANAPGTTRTRSKAATSGSTGASTSTTSPGKSTTDALAALEQAGFLRFTDGDSAAFDAFPAHTSNVLVVTGDGSHFLGSGLTTAVVRSLVEKKVPTEVAAVYEPGNDPTNAPDRGAVLASVLDDQALSRTVSTVDDLELEEGRVASVLAFEILGSGNIGHYGYGAGASAPLPPHRS